MYTLLQHLIIETLPEETDPILRSFLDTVLPEVEQQFSLIPALGGSEEFHCKALAKSGDKNPKDRARSWASRPDQSLLAHVLNALLIAWKVSEHLPKRLALSEAQKRLLCLAMILHDYDKAERGQKEPEKPPKAHEISRVLTTCRHWGEQLSFGKFWPQWQDYLLEITYLAQNTHHGSGNNPNPALWERDGHEFQLDDRDLDPLRSLLAFGDIAVHMGDPAEVATSTKGTRLQDHLELLYIEKELVYHRLRDCRGLITNQIHNGVVNLATNLDWQPIFYLAQGTVYLVSPGYTIPDLETVQKSVWQFMVEGVPRTSFKGLASYCQRGDIGFVRDGKGVKVAPLTLELFSPSQLIQFLPTVIENKVANKKNPATPKRLEKLNLEVQELEKLKAGADLRADRVAEFLILLQREFFEGVEAYTETVLGLLELQETITPDQTKVQSGGVNYGWYHVAAHYVSNHRTLDLQQIQQKLEDLAQKIMAWATEAKLLPPQDSPTKSAFMEYVGQYLEMGNRSGNQTVGQGVTFDSELEAYSQAKSTNQAICSLSSGEATAEDQLDSVVLFKPQQYSNKNALGGGRIKRGISKIWALEMLLRQASWQAPAGKLEDQRPVFLYLFPAYVYSPQIAVAIRRLVKKLKRVNLWEVRKQWLSFDMQLSSLRYLSWCDPEEEPEAGGLTSEYSIKDLPFMAMTYTTTRGKTNSDAWAEPAFLALALPFLLGVRVVVTPSPDPLYANDQEFLETVKLDGPAGFWNLAGLPPSIRLQELESAWQKLLTAYTLHMDNRGKKPDARWQAFNGTVRDLSTDVLNVFAIANEGLRKASREPPIKEVNQVYNHAEIWSEGDPKMQHKLKVIEQLTSEYYQFYFVDPDRKECSSHAILLPLSKALETILSVPGNWEHEELINIGSGMIQDALDRQSQKKKCKRPFLAKERSIPYPQRQAEERQAINVFMTTCVEELFGQMCRGDRALLQENRNRIKSGAEFIYRKLAWQAKQKQTKQEEEDE
jgi:CRISPR-associated protein Csc3